MDETVEVVIRLPKKVYEKIQQIDRVISGRRNGKTIEFALWNGVKNGIPLPKRYNVDILLQKATDEVFVQCKQFNERFPKDWNEGFNDGMFHTLTIIKEIIKADKGEENGNNITKCYCN